MTQEKKEGSGLTDGETGDLLKELRGHHALAFVQALADERDQLREALNVSENRRRIGSQLSDERIVELANLARKYERERDEWKRRAIAHGCDAENGDVDCG